MGIYIAIHTSSKYRDSTAIRECNLYIPFP